MEKLKMEFDNDDRAESGNSLFAEVTDLCSMFYFGCCCVLSGGR